MVESGNFIGLCKKTEFILENESLCDTVILTEILPIHNITSKKKAENM